MTDVTLGARSLVALLRIVTEFDALLDEPSLQQALLEIRDGQARLAYVETAVEPRDGIVRLPPGAQPTTGKRCCVAALRQNF